MPRTVSRTLAFPLAGVVRSGAYRDQTRPYSAPWAVNVRGVETLEGRGRGGSRPGLVEVEGVTETATGVWEWPNGEAIEWENDAEVQYSYTETLITGPGGVSIINPAALITVTADVGDAPTDYTASCVYRDRVILGKGNAFYASRLGNHADWNYGAEMTDDSRAVAGAVGMAGQPGGDLVAIIPFRDKALVLATRNSLYVLEGDPATGAVRAVDEDIGIIAPYGWAFDGEVLAFLSNDGIYIGPIGQRPARFSEGRIPWQLKNVDTSANTVTMAYDPGARGFHLFITPASGSGHHYFLDMANRAIWPVAFGSSGHQPVIAARILSANLERVMLQGRDGTWREFQDSAANDDGTSIQSHVLLGPVRIAADDVRDSMLAEIHGLMGAIPSSVTWRVLTGDEPETVADAAVAGVNAVLAGNSPSGVAASGSWTAGRNFVSRPRARGAWLVVWISAETKWACEAVAIVARQLGRNRS